MKLLSLVRHAASDHSATLPDRDRPLNAPGREGAAEMAKRWHRRTLVPDLIASSPAVRARQTALALAAGLGSDLDAVRFDERLYLASAGELLELIHETDAGVRHLMVIGHNPGITTLAHMLCPGLPLPELPPAALCTLQSGARSWRRLEATRIALVACDRP